MIAVNPTYPKEADTMSLAQRLKQARLEAGLSQRQLCAGEITRNMLSQIENGSAKPSMATLQYLAGRLGKPVSYFLEENPVISVNQAVMAAARAAWARLDAAATDQALLAYRGPDPVFDWEYALLSYLCALALAQRALKENRTPYARQLLQKAAGFDSPYITPAQRQRYWLLLAQADPAELPEAADRLELDEGLLVKAQAALETAPEECVRLLKACRDQNSHKWHLTMGRARMLQGEYTLAAAHLSRVELEFPAQALPWLEICYRELKDFEKAYAYACRQR